MERLFINEGFNCSRVDYVFCSDDYLLKINKEFLKHSTLTDIITFDFSENELDKIGEIYISIDRVTENAIIFKTPLQQEILRVIFHGALHICGFKDKTRAERQKMRNKEDHYLLMFHVKHPKKTKRLV